jgi:peptide/nickel transport system permease protein
VELTFGTLCLGTVLLLGAFLAYIMATGSRSLRNFLITRLLLTIPTIWVLVTIVFVAMRVLPGDPAATTAPQRATEEDIQRRRERMGLDAPVTEQYINYIVDLVQLDFGETYSFNGQGSSMNAIIERRLPATIELIIPASVIMLIFGIYSGAYAANNHRGAVDYGLRISSVVLYSIPIFWMGLILQMIFARELGILPVSRRFPGQIPFETRTNIYLLDALLDGQFDAAWLVLKHMVLPTVTLSIALIGVFVRLTRSNMIEVLQEDFVNASRARGVPENQVVYRHALRNSFIPIMTFIGLQIAVLMGGAILTETTFSWDGMGKLISDGIRTQDFIVVQGAVTVFAVIVGLTSTLTDILYAFIDPRIRY